ncbi:hypothetical protein Q1695_010906 [Nippostrongylus brasiliensis]|nr:hypothetical protein Q1695_010906 [Nippostrongylus brasiliensis]
MEVTEVTEAMEVMEVMEDMGDMEAMVVMVMAVMEGIIMEDIIMEVIIMEVITTSTISIGMAMEAVASLVVFSATSKSDEDFVSYRGNRSGRLLSLVVGLFRHRKPYYQRYSQQYTRCEGQQYIGMLGNRQHWYCVCNGKVMYQYDDCRIPYNNANRNYNYTNTVPKYNFNTNSSQL